MTTNALPDPPSDEEVRLFYSEQGGDRMFQQQFLTPEVDVLMASETLALEQWWPSFGANQLVEIGCGFGRHLEWAVRRRLKYVGVDLVDWLVALGRAQAQLVPNAAGRVEFHVASAEQLDRVLDRAGYVPAQTVSFFPFNCFGTIARPEAAAEAAVRAGCAVFLSLFRPEDETTKIRARYYEHCGYQNVSCRVTDRGSLVTSTDGLHSFGYEPEFVDRMFDRLGYRALARIPISPLAQGLVYGSR